MQKILTFILLVSVLPFSAEVSGQTRLRLDPESFDFGSVPRQSTVAHRFRLTTVGPDTTNLVDIKAGCGCLAITPSAGSLTSRDTLELLVYWETRDLELEQRKPVYLFTDIDGKPLKLSIEGTVSVAETEGASFVRPPVIRFDTAQARAGSEKLARIQNISQEPYHFALIANSHPDAMAVRLPEEAVSPGETGVIRFVPINLPEGKPFAGSVTVEIWQSDELEHRFTIPYYVQDNRLNSLMQK